VRSYRHNTNKGVHRLLCTISKSASDCNRCSQVCSMQLTACTSRQEHNNSSNMIGIIKGKQHTRLGAMQVTPGFIRVSHVLDTSLLQVV
jgi:hypothetical protein